MLKRITILSICLLSFFLTGCGLLNPKYIEFKEQTDIGYYSNEIIERLNNKESFTLEVFDTNFYKSFPVKEEESDILYNFFNSININNYEEEFDIKSKEQFKLIANFKNQKYIINVFDDETVTIHPWDGNYSEDVINMSSVPLSFNLYDFCKYVQKK